jgi:hypothetical protein
LPTKKLDLPPAPGRQPDERKGEKMKRFPLYLALCLLSLFAAVPIASAMPGDCFDTCNIEAPCSTATDTCSECIREWDTDECLEWRETTCQFANACGQCTVLAQWTQHSTGPWNYWKSTCYTDPNPDVVHDTYNRPHYTDTYQRQRCNGVERVVLMARKFEYHELCRKLPRRACTASDPRSGISSAMPSCPF